VKNHFIPITFTQNKEFMNIAIIGYGKMGKTIEQLASSKGHEIGLVIDHDTTSELNFQNLQKIDVAIEFSRPESAFNNIQKCLQSNVPVISGTTGWLDKMEEIKKLCNELKGAFFYASNFSVGVNVFFEINRQLAKMMNHFPDYDISMEEIHHTQKLDAPSGTAITLANSILSNIDRKNSWVNEVSKEENKLAIISKRIVEVPGTHSIYYESPIDTIEIKHTAHSRAGFALGAISAAEWIIGRKGCFGMKDLLGF
jgi:4-hydroxy-tetrahydrodipicolinate reductase